MAGLNTHNLDYFAEAVDSVVRETKKSSIWDTLNNLEWYSFFILRSDHTTSLDAIQMSVCSDVVIFPGQLHILQRDAAIFVSHPSSLKL